MPRYFIDTTENDLRSDDDEGLEFADERRAVAFTWSWLREVLLDLRTETQTPRVELTLRDGDGRMIYRVAANGERITSN